MARFKIEMVQLFLICDNWLSWLSRLSIYRHRISVRGTLTIVIGSQHVSDLIM